MNAKTIFSLTVLSAVTVASAVVTTDNTLCRIEVASGTKSTIVAVPLVKIGTADGAIPVTDLVLTDNLSVGDTILHWNGSAWDAWVISGGKWTPTVISEGSKNSTSAPAAGTALARGDAIWVNRANPTVTEDGVTRAKPFFIYGQVATTDSPATLPEIVPGAYTMMGNTALEPVAINSITFNGTPKKGDKIAIATTKGIGAKEYTYNGTKWAEATLALDSNGVLRPTVTETAATIPAGQGFWYISK